MPLCEEICRAEQKYMQFFGTVTERDFRKKSTAQKHMQMMQRCGLFQKARSVMVPKNMDKGSKANKKKI